MVSAINEKRQVYKQKSIVLILYIYIFAPPPRISLGKQKEKAPCKNRKYHQRENSLMQTEARFQIGKKLVINY